jgi:hypothetical protein
MRYTAAESDIAVKPDKYAESYWLASTKLLYGTSVIYCPVDMLRFDPLLRHSVANGDKQPRSAAQG